MIEIGAFKKSNLLVKALHIVQDKDMNDENFRKELVNKTLKKLFIDDDLFDLLEELGVIYKVWKMKKFLFYWENI
ncbi:hypothetical protein [Chryseobacterium indologenes]|uniref:hypothetical protein n=1 Tax=Chryseobacterium indologenes TaxID=253 RepID=UPI0016287DBF|nr:hypothetical protein [Chryseobacterium indologenes]